MIAQIERTPTVCGGAARLRNTRVPVWTLVRFKQLGADDADILANYPSLTQDDLHAAWDYYELHRDEINRAIREQEEDEQNSNGLLH